MSLLPSPILAAADMQEVVFVIVFLVVGFLQWLFSLLKQKREAAERERQIPTSPEEAAARRQAWEQQTRPEEVARPAQVAQPVRRDEIMRPAPDSRAPAPASPPAHSGGGLGELMESLRRSIEEVSTSQPTGRAPAPVRPPILPGSSRAASAHAHPVPPPLAVSARSQAATDALAAPMMPTMPLLGTNVAVRRAHPLTEMLQTTHGYKQAFILREVLGPCKALENDPV